MNYTPSTQIETVINALYKDAEYDYFNLIKGAAKSIFRPMQPSDFSHAYLAISKEQGENLVTLIKANHAQNIVEFGTSFGTSTLFLAQGARETGGTIITTELIASKARKARKNFQRAGVEDLIEIRIGDALQTLKDHDKPIDLLVLDGWKDLYLSLFRMLEPNFHPETIVYVDNADMTDSRQFLGTVSQDSRYRIQYEHQGKVALIAVR